MAKLHLPAVDSRGDPSSLGARTVAPTACADWLSPGPGSPCDCLFEYQNSASSSVSVDVATPPIASITPSPWIPDHTYSNRAVNPHQE